MYGRPPGYGGDVTAEQTEQERLLSEVLAMRDAMAMASVPARLAPLLEVDLTMQQLKMLMILVATDGGGTGQGLARSMGVSLATVSGIIDRLEAQGMVERVADQQDHRVRRILATAQGRKTVSQLVATEPELSRNPLELMELDDLRALAQGFRALLRILQVPPA